MPEPGAGQGAKPSNRGISRRSRNARCRYGRGPERHRPRGNRRGHTLEPGHRSHREPQARASRRRCGRAYAGLSPSLRRRRTNRSRPDGFRSFRPGARRTPERLSPCAAKPGGALRKLADAPRIDRYGVQPRWRSAARIRASRSRASIHDCLNSWFTVPWERNTFLNPRLLNCLVSL